MKFYLVLAASLLTLALLTQWIRLPLANQGVWMSPDETANIMSAVSLADHGTFKIENPLLKNLPWVFPRSFVPLSDQGAMAPVGFLGMPLVLAIAYKIIGIFGLLFFTPLFAALTLWALWKCLPKTWSKGVRWAVLLTWISFPTVIIYANRGSFSNLFITCLAIWLWWLLAEAQGRWAWPVAGAVLGLACMARPTEIVWLLPVAVFAIIYRKTNCHSERSAIEAYGHEVEESLSSTIKQGIPPLRHLRDFGRNDKLRYGLMALAFLIVLGIGAYLGYQTYGHWLASGYQIRSETVVSGQSSVVSQQMQTISLLKTLPFQFHPRLIIWNAHHYLLDILWPWLLIVLGAIYISVRDKVWSKPNKWIVLAFGWTMFWLVVFYGNGIYQDHVGVNVASMGNSYLRYLLPLSVLAAVSVGMVLNKLWKYWSLRALGLAMVVFLMAMGQWSALLKDNEGMVANAVELNRYAEIRDQARSLLAPQTVVLSDRSDKIFFPVFNVASPMPDDKRVQALLDAGYSVALFLQTQTNDKLAQWWDRGFDLEYGFSDANQTMYTVTSNGNQAEIPKVDQSPTL
ncbi:MAG: glycosyltransferase family 39 protein [Patescibacteria group bacterium]|jgi:hypothetical protein